MAEGRLRHPPSPGRFCRPFQKNIPDTELLTDTELQVLQQLVIGNSYKQIADVLSIGIETVRTHIKHIYAKLHVRSMSQAVAKAINQKIV